MGQKWAMLHRDSREFGNKNSIEIAPFHCWKDETDEKNTHTARAKRTRKPQPGTHTHTHKNPHEKKSENPNIIGWTDSVELSSANCVKRLREASARNVHWEMECHIRAKKPRLFLFYCSFFVRFLCGHWNPFALHVLNKIHIVLQAFASQRYTIYKSHLVHRVYYLRYVRKPQSLFQLRMKQCPF